MSEDCAERTSRFVDGAYFMMMAFWGVERIKEGSFWWAAALLSAAAVTLYVGLIRKGGK